MTNTTETAATVANANDAGSKPWVERFGTLTSAVKRQGRKGTFVTFEIDCKKFKQTGVAFSAKAIEAILAAGVGSKVWAKGPIELRDVTKGDATYQEETFKAVYFANRSVAKAEKTEIETPADDQVVEPTAEVLADVESAFA